MIDPLPIIDRCYKAAAANSRFFSSVVARLNDTCVVHLANKFFENSDVIAQVVSLKLLNYVTSFTTSC